MPREDLDAILGAIEAQSFSDGKLNAVRMAMRDRWASIDQVGALVGAFSFGSDQVRVVEICAPHVVDPQNAFRLAEHFSFSSDAEQALAAFE